MSENIVKTELNLTVGDFKLSYDRNFCKEVVSPFNGKMEEQDRVIQYKVSVSNHIARVTFDYFGSIADCNYAARYYSKMLVEHVKGELETTKSEEATIPRDVRKADADKKGRKHSSILDSYYSNSNNRFPECPTFFGAKSVAVVDRFKNLCRKVLGQTPNFHTGRSIVHMIVDTGEVIGITAAKYMDKKELQFAFRAFVQDAEAGCMELDDFQDNFGYERASECVRVWEACKESKGKLESIKISQDDLYTVLEELSQMGIE